MTQHPGRVDPEYVVQNEQTPENVGSSRQIKGAAVAGGLAGLVLAGPVIGLAAAAGTAYVAGTKEGKVGNFARKSGDAMADAGRGLKKFDQKHQVTAKTTKEVKKCANWISGQLQDKKSKTSQPTY